MDIISEVDDGTIPRVHFIEEAFWIVLGREASAVERRDQSRDVDARDARGFVERLFLKWDARHLDFDGATFDVAYSLSPIEHLGGSRAHSTRWTKWPAS